jgi:hypothetical protein
MEEPLTDMRQSGSAKPPCGIGGWLILVAVQQILGLLAALAVLAVFLYKGVAWEDAVGQTIAAGVIAFTTYAFLAKKRMFKGWFTAETLLFMFVELVGASGLAQMIGVVIGNAIWLAYIWRSRRVANTFVN